MVVKGFNLYIIDDQDNIVADLGPSPYVIQQEMSNFWTGTRTVDTHDVDYTYFNNVVDTPIFMGNRIPNYYTDEQIDLYKPIAPLTEKALSLSYGGSTYKFLLSGNDSGYYAKSSNILGQGYSLFWTLYDNNDNVLTSNLNAVTYGFPCCDSASICNLCSADIFNSVLSSTYGHTIRIKNQPIGTSQFDVKISSSSLSYYFVQWFNHLTTSKTPIITDDPYSQGGSSSGGGGTGTFTDSSDQIDFPGLPTLSAIGTGFITLYNPTIAQMVSLANYMWNEDPTTIDFWKKIVADPIDLILGLNIVPVAVPDAGTKSVVVGAIDTGVNMIYSNTQYVEVDCGSINVSEFWGAYLDYSPYTKIEIYLPYCGVHPLVADEVMGKSVTVKYHVDVLSGSCVAYVKCGDSVLYQFAGNCASQIPVTANQFGDMIRSAISIASSIGTMVATDGATAPMAIGTIASTATNSTALKPSVEKSGAMGGMSGQLGIQKPYLIITRPKQCVPENQNKYIGYPSFVTKTLADLEGYNEIASIHLENISATAAELDEIESILKSGVIF